MIDRRSGPWEPSGWRIAPPRYRPGPCGSGRCHPGRPAGPACGQSFWASGLPADFQQNRILGMHAVFRLVEDDRRLGFEYGVGGFHPPFGRQAVHEEALFAGGGHQCAVHLKAFKARLALLGLILLTHGGPHVGINDVGVFDRRLGIVADLDLRQAGRLGIGNGFGVGSVTLRAGADEMQGQALGQPQPGVHDIVAVAHVDHLEVIEVAPVLQNGEHVGHDLAGVVVVGQAVDYRHAGIFGQLEHVGVVEKPGHDHVVIAGDHPGDVLDRLALADGNVRRSQVKGMAAHAEKAGLEGDARACRGFGKDHGHAVILEGLVVFTPLETCLDLLGQGEGGVNLIGAEIGNMQKITFHGANLLLHQI
ncbi:hypothetical protein DESC_150044 [Desulfosarcina cetonica]|nr:hypothetical protein DESC_150044 [Desulfosarcina cetonica]